MPTSKKSRRDMLCALRALGALGALGLLSAAPAFAQQDRSVYSDNELVENGHRFFGSVSRGLTQLAATRPDITHSYIDRGR